MRKIPVALLTTIVLAPDTPDTAVGAAEFAVIVLMIEPTATLVDTTNCPTATWLFGASVMVALAFVVAMEAENSIVCVVSVAPAFIG